MNSARTLTNIWRNTINSCLTSPSNISIQQKRNTFILKRRHDVPPFKKNSAYPRLRKRHKIYDLVEDTDVTKKPPLKIILTEFVEGVGNAGELVTLPRMKAYNSFLLPGLAVYASPDNLKKFDININKESSDEQKSIFLERTINVLRQFLLNVVMSAQTPWTLEKWHVRSAFRKAGVYLNDDCLTLPERQISGPNFDIENKEFYVIVTINKTEKVTVRCRIHHWSNDPQRSIPRNEEFYLKPSEPIYPEDKSVLDSLPLPYFMEQKMKKEGII